MGKPSIPMPTNNVQPPPKQEDAAVQEAAAEAARRRRSARGYRATILSQNMPGSASALKDTLGS